MSTIGVALGVANDTNESSETRNCSPDAVGTVNEVSPSDLPPGEREEISPTRRVAGHRTMGGGAASFVRQPSLLGGSLPPGRLRLGLCPSLGLKLAQPLVAAVPAFGLRDHEQIRERLR